MKINKLKIENIIRDINLRPRGGTNTEAVERYKELYRSGMSKPVTIQKKGLKLIDGFHRVQAKEELHIEDSEKFDEYIDIEYEDIADDELLARATELNIQHGVPLSIPEQNKVIGKLLAQGKTQEQIGKIFNLSRTTINWRIKNDQSLKKSIVDRTKPLLLQEWMDGKTQEEAAKLLEISPGRASQIISEFKNNILEQWQTGTTIEEIQKLQEIEVTPEQINNILKDKKLGNKNKELVDIPKIIQGDAFKELLSFPDESIDLIIIDPPYNISTSEKVTKKKGKMVELNIATWDKQNEGKFDNLIEQSIQQIKRVLNKTGNFYIFIDKIYISNLWNKIKKQGLIPKNVIVWRKTNPVPDTRGRNWVSATEYILFGVKTNEFMFNFINQKEMHNIISTSLCGGDERTEHPTQKPIELLKQFINVSSNEKDTVLDFFAGVGSTGIAAKQLNRNFFLIEKEKEWTEICKTRILEE